MPDFTPADVHFASWFALYMSADPEDMFAYARLTIYWNLSMAIQVKLGAIP
jgi:hypothetical protein